MGRVEAILKQREDECRLRTLHPRGREKEGKIYFEGKEYVNFSSNDYLGLSSHPKIKQAAKNALDQWGVGSSGSRLLSGDLDIHHQLEARIASFKGKHEGLVFNSGYQANLGVISSLCKRGDVIFSDRLNHASIVDGITLSRARSFRFVHNDVEHLELLLRKERRKFREALIVTETIFSMDGDRSPLKDIVELSDKYYCTLMVDEAHATGVFGKRGSGVVEEEGVTERVDVIMGTFSKALGSFGAYVVCSSKLKSYFINYARSFIYSTSLPAAVIAANMASLDLIGEEPFRRRVLLENSTIFREKLRKRGFNVRGTSQIVPLIVNSNQKAMDISQKLRHKGYWVFPIRYPTVPKGEARVRFSLTYHHSQELLDKLADDINESF